MDNFRKFEDISVELVGHVASPYETAVASARTCYSGRGIVRPEEVSKDEKAVALRDKIASSTLQAGHLTTRQHAHFVFSISGISRHCLWAFLHSHPYYNSEQVSQRYVRVKRGSFVKPPLEGKTSQIYEDAVDLQMSTYERLIETLKAPLSADYFDRFKARKKDPEKWKNSIDKRAFEVARYALGVGTTAYLYHTVSSLTLLRYAKLAHAFETKAEQKILVQKMLDCVLAIDPLFEKELEEPFPLESTLEYQFLKNQATAPKASESFLKDFDRSLEGKVSKLVAYLPETQSVLATALRVALGKSEADLSEDRAISLLLDPKENKLLADTLNLTTLDRLSQILHHVSFAFKKKISHTADSQDQRHRTTPSSRPILGTHYMGKPDFITPFGITQSAEATDLYNACMEKSFEAINQLLDSGVSEEYAFYLLPNSYPIRFVSSGTLFSLQHKWRLRACYNAQEEIFKATVDELSQLKAVLPKIAEHLKAPCYVRQRADIKPYCPEGDRFCGVPVWKQPLEQYQRKSL